MLEEHGAVHGHDPLVTVVLLSTNDQGEELLMW